MPSHVFLKNPDAVIGPGDTIRLPAFTVPWMFMHEAELGIVIKGSVRGIRQENWRNAVFGYTSHECLGPVQDAGCAPAARLIIRARWADASPIGPEYWLAPGARSPHW
jgi:hypothetical protein